MLNKWHWNHRVFLLTETHDIIFKRITVMSLVIFRDDQTWLFIENISEEIHEGINPNIFSLSDVVSLACELYVSESLPGLLLVIISINNPGCNNFIVISDVFPSWIFIYSLIIWNWLKIWNMNHYPGISTRIFWIFPAEFVHFWIVQILWNKILKFWSKFQGE